MQFSIARAVQAAGFLSVALAAGAAQATALMPSFADVPAGWTTDRYDPTTFANVGSFQGRDNVLGIGITSAGDLANRPSSYQSTFYDTQGRQHAVSGGAGSVLGADLFIERSWDDAANGSVRTDLWGVLSDAAANVTDYGIIGFTNYGGAPRLRVWDADTAGGWVDLGTALVVNDWMSLEIDFTGSSLDYRVDGNLVYSDQTIGGTQFTATIMQAYNFADPSIAGATPVDYTAHWANTAAAVPEPGSMALAGLALLGLVAVRRRG